MVKPMKSKLKHLNLELTNRCNYRCVSCPTTFSKFMRGDISSDLFKSILDETGYHIKKIYFWNYGESLLHPDVVNLFEYVRKYSCKKIVSTNGSNLNCFTNLNFLTALDEIILSINGLTQNTYQFHQRGGNLEEVISGVKRLARTIPEKSTKLVLQFVINTVNQYEISELRKFASDIKIDEVILKTFNVMDNQFETYNKFVPIDKRYSRYPNGLFSLYRPGNKAPCLNSMVINWSGDVSPCCWDYHRKYTFGNVSNKGVYDIWNSPEMLIHREKIFDNNYLDICNNCPSQTTITRIKISKCSNE